MAHIEIRYCCSVCNRKFINQSEAIKCVNSHPIKVEKWAIGKEKSVRVFNDAEEEWALRESDISDLIKECKIVKEDC